MRITLKIIFSLCAVFIHSGVLNGQFTVQGSIIHDSKTRSYILYAPASYSPDKMAPLVFNLHGHTSNASTQMTYGNFMAIADTAGFLVVHPQGINDAGGSTHWNADWGSGVDDVGFLSSLIDSLDQNYSIDHSRIYSTGFSNGGYMSYTLACHLSNRIAAIASVAGSMTNYQISTGCKPSRPVPIMEIHGTADESVPYNGSSWSASIDKVLNFWISNNQCENESVFTAIENINTTDRSTAEQYLNKNGSNGTVVDHYKIISGAHTWPGSNYSYGVTNRDINASLKIWEFFSGYTIEGKTSTTALENPTPNQTKINIFPNPCKDILHISTSNIFVADLKVYNLLGQEMDVFVNKENNAFSVSLRYFNNGIYFVKLIDDLDRIQSSHRIIKYE